MPSKAKVAIGGSKGKQNKKIIEEKEETIEMYCAIDEDGGQHAYVIPMLDVVCDPATLKKGDPVTFSYSKKVRHGVVIGIGEYYCPT